MIKINLENIEKASYSVVTGVFKYETTDGKRHQCHLELYEIKNFIDLGLDINFTLLTKSLLSGNHFGKYITLREFGLNLVTFFEKAGVSPNNAIRTVFGKGSPSNKKLQKYIDELHQIFEEEFPDVNYNKTNGNNFIVKRKNSEIFNENENIKAYFLPKYNCIFIEEKEIENIYHEEIHRMSLHDDGKQVGFMNLFTEEGKALNEGMANFLYCNLMKKNIVDNCATFYIGVLTQFIPFNDLIKIFFEGTTEDLKKLFNRYGDEDSTLLELTDRKLKNKEGYSGEILLKIFNMLIHTIQMEAWDLTIEENRMKIESIKMLLLCLKEEEREKISAIFDKRLQEMGYGQLQNGPLLRKILT